LDEMRSSSVSDALTGCHNRAYAFAALEVELRRARRTHRPISVVIVDVDGLKAINDQHGQVCGDELLKRMGETLRHSLRLRDIKARYGGDEFLITLPETGASGADRAGEHIRRVLERTEVRTRTSVLSCRVSIGVAVSDGTDVDATSLVAQAEDALLSDKRRGP